MRKAYDKASVEQTIDSLVSTIATDFPSTQPLNIIGIRTRGETLASRIAEKLRSRGYHDLGRGVLDITLYRDDLSEIGAGPLVRPTQIDCAIDAVPMVLVDDVLFTGRTVRAALNALADYGRPKVIRLAVLADRGGRELPIQADYTGIDLGQLPFDQKVCVRFTENDGVDEITVEPRHAL
ncbi:MAG TPA: bifunctional pyr operon transcriptional regulator/uracil phosphoribosyltransferase PyrR [Tepidisphaeraceae bacterium]|jgi:pyrimidine operon attenuation protein/uracil phosphoribosyltransferase|nr:bifunctional pyr operon transcriptional regulator/uracil phosphoribosyltransferase PyrR [Tepidisphaeraceae bacterium]